MTPFRTPLLVLLALAASSAARLGAVEHEHDRPFLHPLFSDHTVLQRDMPVPVWGWTAPGGMVTVAMNGAQATATAGSDGRWMAKIGPFPAGGPYTMTVTGAVTVTVSDILMGDVWICSGQSNMEMGIGACNYDDEIKAAEHPDIRLLTVPRKVAKEPTYTADLAWLPCHPDTVTKGLWGGFSAAGYFFGRELNRELKVPIGLIHTSWGGTIAEAWTSAEGLAGLPDFNDRVAQVVAARSVPEDEYANQLAAWYKANDPGTGAGWEKPGTDVKAWNDIAVPKPWEQSGVPGFEAFDGVAWYRREFDAPADWVGKDLALNLGPIDDLDTTWVNGQPVGSTERYDIARTYTIPAKLVRKGRNVIAVRVLDTGGLGGIWGKPEQLSVGPAGAAPLSLAGTWKIKDSSTLAKLGAPPSRIDSSNPNVVTVLSNGMLEPIVPYAVKGAIWYQGESNSGRAWQYRTLLPAMITDWRTRFGCGDFGFHIVSLAAFQKSSPQPGDNDWAELREAQALTAKQLKNCGIAMAIDIGNADDIHPKDKREVGRRLALSALANTYGQAVEWSGPWYSKMAVEGAKIRLHFDHLGGGLVAKGDKLTGFAIAGADHVFTWADAQIDGDTVVVSAASVAAPEAVRYAWDANPVCDLYNKAGLPAVPFRTDDFPARTRDAK